MQSMTRGVYLFMGFFALNRSIKVGASTPAMKMLPTPASNARVRTKLGITSEFGALASWIAATDNAKA
jgi:hypothetical protein